MSCELFLDAETIPCQREGIKEAIRAKIKAPANMSKPESIEKWMSENADSAAHEQWLKTACNGALGEIVCVSYAFGNDPVRSVRRDYKSIPESELLEMLYSDMLDCAGGSLPPVKLVGHNIINFDARFLFQRSVVHAVRPPFTIPTDTRYNGDRIYDTMLAWAGWNNYAKLTDICSVLGISVKSDGIDGSMVWDYVQAGRISEVAKYCNEDVEAVRKVYHRLNFTGGAK